MDKYSTFLFANPSFLEGIARLLDLGGTLEVYNNSETTQDADVKALQADWYAIGNDLKHAVDLYSRDHTE